MPEIAPEGDFTPNIDRPFNERSMVLQAWGAYSNLWPVVHQQLGVAPDLGRDRLRIVPQLPSGQHRIAGSNIRIGAGSMDVVALKSSRALRTIVEVDLGGVRVRLGHVLPAGSHVQGVLLDGHRVGWHVQRTSRGRELFVRIDGGHHILLVRLS